MQINKVNTSFANQLLNNEGGKENKSEQEQVNAILTGFGLNWKVEKTPLYLQGSDVPSDYFGIHKSGSNNVFTTAKDDYELFQNSELAETMLRISQKTGYSLHNGGELNDGAKVYLQFNSPNRIIVGENKHEVKGYLTGLSSHDGTKSLGFGETNVTVICQNTFHMAFKDMSKKIRHTKSMVSKIDAYVKEINGIVDAEKSLFETFIKLAEIPATQKNMIQMIQDLTKVDTSLTELEMKEKYSTYAINRSKEFLLAIGKEVAQKGQTMWGLFNGVTQYTNHVMTVPKRENARFESIVSGSAYTMNNEGFASVMRMSGLIEA